jgi:hypothetical protein
MSGARVRSMEDEPPERPFPFPTFERPTFERPPDPPAFEMMPGIEQLQFDFELSPEARHRTADRTKDPELPAADAPRPPRVAPPPDDDD